MFTTMVLPLSACKLNDHLHSLPSELSCFSSTCSNVTCCLQVSPLARNFRFSVHIDSCNYKVTMEIENFQTEFSLIDFDWAESHEVYLKGIIQARCVCVSMTNFVLIKSDQQLQVIIWKCLPLHKNPCTHSSQISIITSVVGGNLSL